MAQGILIIAESGSGKSTAIEQLDPKETFIINVANKALPFKGWRKKYVQWSKDNPKGNLYSASSSQQIEACMKYVSEKRPDIKNLVIDDFQYMSSFEFFDLNYHISSQNVNQFVSFSYFRILPYNAR